jgi:inosine-uridine nucleoside N-ribohydrolase
MAGSTAPRPVIIDTDPGVDDAMAIFFALRHRAVEVIGLTTIFGNVTTETATANALRLLDIAGRPDIPVAHGASDPLVRPYGGPVAFVHGDDGQGNVHLPPSARSPIGTTAAQFIVDQVMSRPGEITLVPVGPLTNIALALRLEPRIAEHVREVVLMGGNALGPGNATPAAEANIHNDPEAADVVFGASWPVTMVGLDVTHQVHMDDEHLARYGEIDHPTAQHIAAIVPFYRDFYRDRVGIEGIYVHDSSAIAYVIAPELFTTERWPIRVDTTSSISRGKTWPAIGDTDEHRLAAWHDRPLVNVCVGVDGPAVVQLELDAMSGGGMTP